MAVSMIILNAAIGNSLLVGGIKLGDMSHNRTGASAYLALLVVLSMLAFALPALIGSAVSSRRGRKSPPMRWLSASMASSSFQQIGRQAGNFREVDPRLLAEPASSGGATSDQDRRSVTQVPAENRSEVSMRIALLVATVLPIVLLSHDMATLLDDGLDRVSAPIALSGILIAMIVFLRESITSVRAALQGEM